MSLPAFFFFFFFLFSLSSSTFFMEKTGKSHLGNMQVKESEFGGRGGGGVCFARNN